VKTLIFDTETTGLVNSALPAIHPKQPMAVQVGFKLDAANRVERGVANYLIQTDGWEVHPKAAEITGIDNAVADEFGAQLIPAVEFFLDQIDVAEVVVAHNLRFDVTVMRRMVKVWSEWTNEKFFDPFDGKILICTMVATTPIMKLPPKRNGEYKWPKLSEAMKYFFNEDIEGAHDALVDVRACAKLYYHLMDEGVFA
jgi:DNA polymerase III subunit epsilon